MHPMRPLVSVLLPTARRPEWARQVFRMMAEQTYKDFELVIINSGEPISNLPWFAREVPAIKKGFPEQNGQSITEARGEIMIFMDDDDYYAPTRIERQIEPIIAGRAVMTGVQMYYYVEVPVMCWYHRIAPVPRDPGVPKGWPAPFFEGSGCFHRSVLKHFAAVELKRIWRTPFCMKVKEKGEKIEVIPNQNAVVRVQHTEGSTGDKNCYARTFDPACWKPTTPPPEIPAWVTDFWKRGGAPIQVRQEGQLA